MKIVVKAEKAGQVVAQSGWEERRRTYARPPEGPLLGYGNRNQTYPCSTTTYGSVSIRRNRP